MLDYEDVGTVFGSHSTVRMSFGKTAVIVTGVCPGEKRIVAHIFV